MANPGEATLEVKVTRYDVGRLRLGQLLVPVAVVLTVAARHAPTMTPLFLAFGLQAVGLTVFLTAARRYGWQPLRFEHGVSFGKTGLHLQPREVRRWTLVGRVARLYGGDTSFKLRVRDGGEQVLDALLRSQFGAPVRLERRGSRSVRMTALAVGLGGIVVCALAIARDSSLLAVFGAPPMMLGFAVFGAMSQRAAGS